MFIYNIQPSRMPKILRDNIMGITRPAIQRLILKGGVKSATHDVYDETRGLLKVHLQNAVRDAIIFMENDHRHTVKDEDVRDALKMMGRPVVYSDNKTVVKEIENKKGVVVNRTVNDPAPVAKSCGVYHPRKGGKKAVVAEAQDGGAGKIHFHPGTVVARKVKFYQKHSGHCLSIPKLSFQRMVREIAQDYSDRDIRFTETALTTIQIDAENYLTEIFKGAGLLAQNEKKVRITPKNMQAVCAIRS